MYLCQQSIKVYKQNDQTLISCGLFTSHHYQITPHLNNILQQNTTLSDLTTLIFNCVQISISLSELRGICFLSPCNPRKACLELIHNKQQFADEPQAYAINQSFLAKLLTVRPSVKRKL